ncbi:hypothetical protein ABW19_dt0208311 [Dactylella cylindrospora]|nr:hypothetical protein ABW19_dt0208311 [Dactylella cylindrospora]
MGSFVAERRTDCIWLDPPLLLYLPRLILRCFLRVLRLEPQCAPGCNESLIAMLQFNDQSIVYWCVTHHGYCREYGEKLLKEDGAVENGGKVRRICGWGGELRRWVGEVEDMVKEQSREDGEVE